MNTVKEVVQLVQMNTYAHSCLYCIETYTEPPIKWQAPWRRPYKYEVKELTSRLKREGFSLEEIDTKASELGVVEIGGPIGLTEGKIRGCVPIESLEKVLKALEKKGKRRLK